VAIVNKRRTAQFQKLIENGQKIVKLLPFEKEIQVEEMVKVDFSSLDSIAWGGNGMPAGINLPNYYDVREKEGFKNVIFERDRKPFDKKDIELLDHMKNITESALVMEFDKEGDKVLTAGHELFGHGSGRLIYRDEATGKCPVKLEDPQNPGEFINTCYEKG
jgi:dipeptidyl-peptidase-3